MGSSPTAPDMFMACTYLNNMSIKSTFLDISSSLTTYWRVARPVEHSADNGKDMGSIPISPIF